MKASSQVYCLLLLAGVVLLSGCKQEAAGPEKRMADYLQAWESGGYEAMYGLLSAASKEHITQMAFMERHSSIYSGIEAKSLKLELEPSEAAGESKRPDKSKPVSLFYRASMQTLAGEVSFRQQANLVNEAGEWMLVWTPGLLFPQLAEGDKVKVQTYAPERGEITDRYGQGLAVNEERMQVGLVPGRLPEPADATIVAAADMLQLKPEDVAQKLQAAWVKPDSFVPVAVIAKGDNRLEGLRALQGTVFQATKVRSYPLGEAAAHLTGYLGKINAEEWAARKEQGYRQDDWIGKTGLELVMESRLRGTTGARIYVTDAAGKEKTTIARRDAVNGETIRLSVDSLLQQDIYGQLSQDEGAAAAMHPVTGEVLALVSSPAYDPNLFIAGVSAEQWKAWNDDAHKPLLNRFARTFAPGSAFKPITAAIALEAGVLAPEEERTIQGKQWKKDASWGNYSVTRVSERLSQVNLLKALQTSDNIYFAQIALELGAERFLAAGTRFGFGEPLPFSYPISKSTLTSGSMNNDIQLADSGYGQGEVQMSPLHVAAAYTAFVNQGTLLKPVLELTGSRMERTAGEAWKQQAIRPEVAERINADLIQVVESPEGTGYSAKIPGMKLAGKTGTAELKQSKAEKGKEIGWFVAYNAEKPQLLVAMLVEDAQDRGGSHHVAPKIKHIFEQALRVR